MERERRHNSGSRYSETQDSSSRRSESRHSESRHSESRMPIMYSISGVLSLVFMIVSILLYLNGSKRNMMLVSLAGALISLVLVVIAGLLRHENINRSLTFADGWLALIGLVAPVSLVLNCGTFIWRLDSTVGTVVSRVLLDISAAMFPLIAWTVVRHRRFRLPKQIAEFLNAHTKMNGLVFHVALGICFIRQFIWSTMFQQQYEAPVSIILDDFYKTAVVVLLFTYVCSFSDMRQLKNKILTMAVVMIGGVDFLFRRDFRMLTICFGAAGAVNKQFRRILQYTFIEGVIIMIVCYWASVNGYIAYLTYNREILSGIADNGIMGHAFGTIYVTDCAAHWLFLMIEYCMLRWRKTRLLFPVDLIVLASITLFNYRYIQGRTSLACMLLVDLGYIIYMLAEIVAHHRKPIHGIKWIIGFIGAAVYAVSCIGMIGYSWFYNEGAEIGILKLVGKITGTGSFVARLRMGHEAMVNYPITLFGVTVEERGGGGFVDNSKEYFYLDSAYVRILMIFGVVMLVTIMFLMMYGLLECAKHHCYLFVYLLAVVAFSGIAEHHLLDIAYNVFLLTPFALLPSRHGGKKYKKSGSSGRHHSSGEHRHSDERREEEKPIEHNPNKVISDEDRFAL